MWRKFQIFRPNAEEDALQMPALREMPERNLAPLRGRSAFRPIPRSQNARTLSSRGKQVRDNIRIEEVITGR